MNVVIGVTKGKPCLEGIRFHYATLGPQQDDYGTGHDIHSLRFYTQTLEYICNMGQGSPPDVRGIIFVKEEPVFFPFQRSETLHLFTEVLLLFCFQRQESKYWGLYKSTVFPLQNRKLFLVYRSQIMGSLNSSVTQTPIPPKEIVQLKERSPSVCHVFVLL